jgi:signal transduction histidine kinase
MKRGDPFRTFFPLLVSLGAYGASWTAFSTGPGATLEAGKISQVAAVIFASAILTFPAILLGPLATGIACSLSLSCLAFLANAAGADLGVIAPASAPLSLALTLAFPAPAGLAGSAAVHLVLLIALRPHSAWGVAIPGATVAQITAILASGALIATLGAALRSRERRLERLTAELERMDTAYRKVADANLDFQTFALFAREEAMENERKRIAGEIHDIIGYTLTNLIMLIQAAQYSKGGAEETTAILEKARAHADESLGEARRALAELRSRDADRPRGANLFLRLTQNFQDVTGVTVRTDFANLPPTLPRVLEKALYRVIQEGLTNAFRHGRANEVDVSFWCDGGAIKVRLRDDGAAVAPVGKSETERAGIGLAGLRDRIEELGGKLEAGPVPGGFALSASVPLTEDEDGR